MAGNKSQFSETSAFIYGERFRCSHALLPSDIHHGFSNSSTWSVFVVLSINDINLHKSLLIDVSAQGFG